MQVEGSVIRLTIGECGHLTGSYLGHLGSVSNARYYLKCDKQKKQKKVVRRNDGQ